MTCSRPVLISIWGAALLRCSLPGLRQFPTQIRIEERALGFNAWLHSRHRIDSFHCAIIQAQVTPSDRAKAIS